MRDVFEVLPVQGQPEVLRFTLTSESGTQSLVLPLKAGVKLNEVLKALKAMDKAAK